MKVLEEYRFFTRRDLRALVEGLLRKYRVYGTVKKDGFPAFGAITGFGDLELAQAPTHISAKEFLFPQKETLLRFNLKDKTHEPVVEAEDQVIIGLHPCDIHAMALMDKVFSYGAPDANYLARRRRTIVIGTDCMPDEYCFCKSLGTLYADSGYDIFLHTLKNGFLVKTSAAGAALVSRYTNARKAAEKDLKELADRNRKREGSFIARLEAGPQELAAVYEKSDSSPVWERIGNICYGCGSCNNVCPTCYCFDVKDDVKASLAEGERVRVWDGCTLEDFAKVAGGHNFRKSRADRLRHRFNRKFRYLSDRFGSHFCVGCGRCSRTCLVKINITEVTNELIREAKKR